MRSAKEELYSDLINHVSVLRKKKGQEQQSTITEYQRLIDEQLPAEFLSKIITNETEFLFKESDKDIEGFFNVILTVLHKLENDAINIISQKIRDCLSVNPTENSQLKIKILTNFFNSFPVKSQQRYEIFYILIKSASEANHFEFIKSQIKDLDLWLEDWSSNTKQKRKIYQLVSNIFKEKNNMLSHQFLFKFLQTFTKDDASEAQEESVRACIEAISIPELYQSDYLLDLAAIQYLENSTVDKNRLTYSLMKIFATEQLEHYLAFQTKHPEFIQSIGLKNEQCLQKIRLLSLATLTAEQSKVPYSLISKMLQIEEDKVESWVINAIAGELIDAKLDQLNRIVNVNSSTQRVFNKSQWAQLGLHFGAWHESVKNLLNVIETAKNTQVKPFYFQSR
ncbi:proteasome component region PCI domain-containing protein [Tieghemostelium lacteum]|uniref:Eukaryotic translation initiation factor 3 subunit M n=1 Tax=Tieghemostelium lacteum TaxID=361077 RepID=A0A151ZH49_TIELA|nr:proteasome component region PCI domain-containing protein [Tieghemostelium lacteum]|eukprot:KYQ93302.1 proteasome component region PCI domain-containing protein [Tieghemostelium lacteum]